MGVRHHLQTDAQVENFNLLVSQGRLAGKALCVEFIEPGRSLDQNSLIQAVYRQIASQTDDQSVNDITRECKLRWGVGILKHQSDKFAAMYDKTIKPHLTYEEKLEAMDFLPVTRLFDKQHATDYIDTLIRVYSQHGFDMTHPGQGA